MKLIVFEFLEHAKARSSHHTTSINIHLRVEKQDPKAVQLIVVVSNEFSGARLARKKESYQTGRLAGKFINVDAGRQT